MDPDKKRKLIEIYYDTIHKCKTTYYNWLLLTNSVKSHYNSLVSLDLKNPRFEKTNVYVFNKDVIDSTIIINKYINENKDPTSKILVLNLASFQSYGGGVKRGAMAQEEELFRKTDYALHKSEHLYPLKMNEFVFTQNVSIIKDGQYNDIPLNNIFMVDMLAIAAIYNPVLIDDKYSTKDYKIMCEKIDTIFRFAIYNGYTYLNLGALGCGAYNNPPQQVVEIYNIYLKKYDKYFDTIIFSIKSTRDDNFNCFNNGIVKLS
jgi:uncharacterized protein (TIGR02452 family)